MSFALTFGGFGDFACLTQLILGTCKILIESYDATEQCNSLVEYITGFNNALECLRPLISGPHPFLPGGARLAPSATNALSNAIGICERDIIAFRKRLVDFRASDDRRFKARLGVFKQRLRWTLSLSKAATQLRATLAEQKNIIELVLAASLAQQAAHWHPRGQLRIGHEPAANGVELVDMMDQIVHVPIQFCFSSEIFADFLRLLFTNRAGAAYVRRRQYRLTVHENPGSSVGTLREATPENWHEHVGHGAVLEMAALGVRTHSVRSPKTNACPTCGTEAGQREEAYRCTYCQTMVSIQEVTVWEEEKQTISPGTDKDWGFMRRIHCWVKKYVLKVDKKRRQLPFSVSSIKTRRSRRQEIRSRTVSAQLLPSVGVGSIFMEGSMFARGEDGALFHVRSLSDSDALHI